MRTTSLDETQVGSAPSSEGTPPIIWASILWNMVVVGASLWLALFIFNMEEFGRLGDPVQYTVALATLGPAVAALYGSVRLFQKKADGRYTTLAIQYLGFIVTLIYLSARWGAFDSYEFIVDGIMRVPWLPAGFAIGYGLNYLASKVDQKSDLHVWLQNGALALSGLTLILILWFSNLLAGINHILSTYSSLDVWLATAAAVIFGVLGWHMLHLGAYFGETPFERQAWQGWLMLSPNVIGFAIFFAGPLLLSFYLSFTDSTVGEVPNVIGVRNYVDILSLQFRTLETPDGNPQELLTIGYTTLAQFGTLVIGAKDVLFWRSLGNTLLYAVMLVPLATIPALILALVLNSKLPGMAFFRAVYFLPSVAAVVGTALIWRWLYDPTIGFFNYWISSVVGWLNGTFGVSLEDPRITWLSDPGVVLISMVLLTAWQVVGFNTVLFLAGLQGIPKVLYEAATVDGANRWEQFTNVTFPMLGPTTFFVIVTTLIQVLQVFNEPYALFPSQPIPINATTSVYYLYRRGFFFFDFGYASAVAWVLFLVIFAITLIQFRVQRSEAYGD